MRRSSVELRRTCTFLGVLAALGTGVASAQLSGGAQRLVDVIEVSDRDGQVDLTVVFSCSMRFVTNLPASEGKEVHIQLVPLSDCGVNTFGQIPSEIPPLSGGSGIITAARVESLAPGQITLTLSFNKSERYVLAQGVDPRGLRVRLVDHSRGAHGRVHVEPSDVVSNFAINLDSRLKPFTPEEITLAHERLQAPVFVSETVVDGEKWYRLRVGPIERRSEADRMLNHALPDYPRAWLAIGDDAVTSDFAAATAAPLPAVERIGSDPPLPPEQLKQTLADARSAMTAHDYPKAIALLTKLQRQPEFPDRARAQELLGLARERSGQLAHAKAEYQEYLRRYPNGEAAERVAYRLKILQAAEAKARTGRDVGVEAQGWQLSGGFSQTARYDGLRVTNSAPPVPSTVPLAEQTAESSALFTDVDFLARRRGESFDFIGRFSGGYDKSFIQGGTATPDPTRVSLASLELLDRPLGLLARLGRQTSNAYGILGSFDGLFLSWQFSPSWALNAAAGYPVNLLNIAPQTAQSFQTLALVYTPRNAHWDGNIFVANQQYDGLRDRQAVGAEGRYLASRGSMVAVVDYDVFYHSLNTASLLGTLQLPARWNVSFDTERRNSPVLTTGNALIGQPFTDLHQMQQVFTDEEIYQLARDRTPVTSYYSLTATHPLGQRVQFTAIASATQSGATPASGGVPAEPATGMLPNYQVQIYASNLWHEGDFNVVTLQHGDTQIGRIDSISATLRFPLGGAWRLAPRFSVERLSGLSDGSKETSYLPSALLDYQRGNKLLQLEVGGQLGSREAFLQLPNGQFVQTQNTTSYYASLSYRINFTH